MLFRPFYLIFFLIIYSGINCIYEQVDYYYSVVLFIRFILEYFTAIIPISTHDGLEINIVSVKYDVFVISNNSRIITELINKAALIKFITA